MDLPAWARADHPRARDLAAALRRERSPAGPRRCSRSSRADRTCRSRSRSRCCSRTSPASCWAAPRRRSTRSPPARRSRSRSRPGANGVRVERPDGSVDELARADRRRRVRHLRAHRPARRVHRHADRRPGRPPAAATAAPSRRRRRCVGRRRPPVRRLPRRLAHVPARRPRRARPVRGRDARASDESRIAPGDPAKLQASGGPQAPVTGAPGRGPAQRPRRDLDPDRAARAPRADHGVARLRARHARPGSGARSPAGSAAATPRRARRLMGISFDAPLALLLLPPLIAIVVAALPGVAAAAGQGPPARVALGRPACCSCRCWCSPSPASSSCSRSTGWPSCTSSTCPTPWARRAARRRWRSCARASSAKEDEDVAGIVAFGGDALVERLPSDLAEIDRIASTPVRGATDIGGGAPARRRAVPGRRPEADRAPLRRQRHDRLAASPRPRSRRRAGSRCRPTSPGSDGADEVLVERLTAPVDGPDRRGGRGERGRHLDRRPAGDRPAVRRRRAGRAPRAVDLVAGANRVDFQFDGRRRRLPRFRVVRRGRPRHVQPERPRRRQHDRQGRAAGARREGRRGRRGSSSSAALETEQQTVDEVTPEALPAGPRRARRLRLDRARRRARGSGSATRPWRPPGRTSGTSVAAS